MHIPMIICSYPIRSYQSPPYLNNKQLDSHENNFLASCRMVFKAEWLSERTSCMKKLCIFSARPGTSPIKAYASITCRIQKTNQTLFYTQAYGKWVFVHAMNLRTTVHMMIRIPDLFVSYVRKYVKIKTIINFRPYSFRWTIIHNMISLNAMGHGMNYLNGNSYYHLTY